MSPDNDLIQLNAQLHETNRRLTELLQRFLPQEVAQQLIETPEAVSPTSEQRDATILFADARNFTAMAEDLSPTQVMALLNVYLRVITEVIHDHQGTVIQYVGDQVMAAFNVPGDQPDHAARAARAALAIRERLEQFAASQRAAGLPVLEFGVGVNSGPVAVGYLGVEPRREYAVIGDTTNTAAHLCAQAAAGEVLLGAATVERLGGLACVRPHSLAQLKRRRKRLPTYELLTLLDFSVSSQPLVCYPTAPRAERPALVGPLPVRATQRAMTAD
jgi:adenylate cyclase